MIQSVKISRAYPAGVAPGDARIIIDVMESHGGYTSLHQKSESLPSLSVYAE